MRNNVTVHWSLPSTLIIDIIKRHEKHTKKNLFAQGSYHLPSVVVFLQLPRVDDSTLGKSILPKGTSSPESVKVSNSPTSLHLGDCQSTDHT